MAVITKPSGVDVNKIWADTGSKVDPGAPKTALGWIDEIPEYEKENWIQNKQDKFIAHVNQAGVPYWDNTTEYQTNKSYTMGSDGVVYRCILTHTNKDPVTAPDTATYWSQAFDAAGFAYSKSVSDARYLEVSSNLSDINNAATARDNLGLGSASVVDTGTNAGNAMLVGAFGIGNSTGATAIPSTNCNSITANGLYFGNSSTTNRPTGVAQFTLLHINHSVNYASQAVYNALTGENWVRSKNNNVWQTWRKDLDSGNVSDYMQTVLDDVDAATARNTLGLGNASTRNAGTSTNELMPVGSFGLGFTSGAWQALNLNALTVTGFYGVSNAGVNLPFSDYFTVEHYQAPDATYAVQFASCINSTRSFVRRKTASTWSVWVELHHTGNFDPATKANVAGQVFTGDITTYRSGSPNTGVIFLNQGGTRYLYYNGTSYQLPGANLTLNGSVALTAANIAAQSFGSRSLSTNGYQELPGGVILQWCRVTVPGQGSAIATFPTAFPNACLSVVSTPLGSSSGGGSTDYWGVNNITTANVTIFQSYDTAHVALIFAIGY